MSLEEDGSEASSLGADDAQTLRVDLQEESGTLSFDAAAAAANQPVPTFSFDDQEQNTGFNSDANTHTLLVNGYEDLNTLSTEEEEYALAARQEALTLEHFSEEDDDDAEESLDDSGVLSWDSSTLDLGSDQAPLDFSEDNPSVDTAQTLEFSGEAPQQPLNFEDPKTLSTENDDSFFAFEQEQAAATLANSEVLSFDDFGAQEQTLAYADSETLSLLPSEEEEEQTLNFDDIDASNTNEPLDFEDKSQTLEATNDSDRQFGVEQPPQYQEETQEQGLFGSLKNLLVKKPKNTIQAQGEQVGGAIHFSTSQPAEVLDFDDDESVTEYFGQ